MESKEAGSTGITRISKACDPCRVRKTRCDIATQAVCSECLKRDQAAGCTIREKARPSRPAAQKLPGRQKVAEKRGRSPSLDIANSPTRDSSAIPDLNQPGPSRHVSFSSYPNPVSPPSLVQARRPPAASSMTYMGSGSSRPTSGPLMVESILEEEALSRKGLELHVALEPENIFDSVQFTRHSLQEIGLTPGDPTAVQQAHHWINTHFGAIHHNTPFLSLPAVLETASKVFSSPQTHPSPRAQHDDLALLYSILALGSLREQTYDSQTKRYRAIRKPHGFDELPATSPLSASSLPSFHSRTTAQCLFRLAQDELESIDQPSETAVQALFVLHTFISNTSMGRRSRDYVARAIMMAHELGLNRQIPVDLFQAKRIKLDKHAARRRSMLYLYVYFSDVYLSALDSHPPLIKRQDYDSDVFDILYQSSSSGVDTPSGMPLHGLRSFVDLVTTIGSVLERLHVSVLSPESRVELVLPLESEIDSLRDRLGPHTFDVDIGDSTSSDPLKRNIAAGSILRQIHFNWSRIALRAPFLRDPLLRHSSLAICARAAMSIVQFHRHVVSAALLNLPWMQIRRMTISTYIIFIAFWRGEITRMECEQAVNSSLEVLCVLGTRWRSATHVRQIVVQLAEKSGLTYKEPLMDEPALQSNVRLILALLEGVLAALTPTSHHAKRPHLQDLPYRDHHIILSRSSDERVEADIQTDSGLERLAAVATNTSEGNMGSMPMFALEEWTNLMNGLGPAGAADPMAQFVNTDLFGQYTDDSGLGPDILDWQGLHQPPW